MVWLAQRAFRAPGLLLESLISRRLLSDTAILHAPPEDSEKREARRRKSSEYYRQRYESSPKYLERMQHVASKSLTRSCCTSSGNPPFRYLKKQEMSFRTAAKTVAVFSLPIRTGFPFWSMSRIQAPQRFFSGTSIHSVPPKDPEVLERNRERKREYAKRWRAAVKEDPEAYKKYLEYNRQQLHTYRAKMKADPTKRGEYFEKKREAQLKYLTALYEDPEVRKAALEERSRYNKKRYANNELYRRNNSLYSWVAKMSVVRSTQVVWTSHKPVATAERIERDCVTCHKRCHGGQKLWWRRLSPRESIAKDRLPEESAVYDRHHCFVKGWPEVGMPENFAYRTDKGGHQRLSKIW